MERKGDTRVQGIYFTNREDIAKTYWRRGGKLLTAYLDIQNPLIITDKKQYYNREDQTTTDHIVQKAKREGYDSIVFKDIEDIGSNLQYTKDIKDNFRSDDYIVFRKEQIKVIKEDKNYGV